MSREVEYNFKLDDRRLRVTHTDVWFAADRAEESHVVIHFPDHQDGLLKGHCERPINSPEVIPDREWGAFETLLFLFMVYGYLYPDPA